jgi:hypothetical protein
MGVPFFFKQWGEWAPQHGVAGRGGRQHRFADGTLVQRLGRKAAGAELDGRQWREQPA